MLDRKGVIYKGRPEKVDQWKSRHAIETKKRTLEDAIDGADVFLGLSAKGAPLADKPKKTSAPSIASSKVLFFVSIACLDFH